MFNTMQLEVLKNFRSGFCYTFKRFMENRGSNELIILAIRDKPYSLSTADGELCILRGHVDTYSISNLDHMPTGYVALFKDNIRISNLWLSYTSIEDDLFSLSTILSIKELAYLYIVCAFDYSTMDEKCVYAICMDTFLKEFIDSESIGVLDDFV